MEPQAAVKRVFGEFSFRDTGGRTIQIDPAWVAANIVRESVPILGPITCHRAIIPAVRAAMTALEQSGHADAVDPSRYAGCYNPRRIAAGAGLSRHSWGLALDLNIGSNPRGTFESQDPALVDAMRVARVLVGWRRGSSPTPATTSSSPAPKAETAPRFSIMTVAAITADLRDEQQALDDVVAPLPDDQWATATPSPGWTVADQIAHLTYFDGTAATAITDPDGFATTLSDLLATMSGADADMDAATLSWSRGLSPAELLDRWRANRSLLLDAAAGLAEGTRVAWYGPSMGAKSFLTARLMEVWAHGQDVVDAVGSPPPRHRPPATHRPVGSDHARLVVREPWPPRTLRRRCRSRWTLRLAGPGPGTRAPPVVRSPGRPRTSVSS